VHLAALKHPILGDAKYGEAEANRSFKRQGLRRMFLHAARLELRHPLTGQSLLLQAPLAPELATFLEGLSGQHRVSPIVPSVIRT
jgi:23S rRNA pseudouridine955/2504/2580 synthase